MRSRLGVVLDPHPVDELRLAGEVDVVGPGRGAGGDQRLAVEGVGADGGDDDPGRLGDLAHRAARRRRRPRRSSGSGACGEAAASRAATASSLARLRPTSAQRSPAGAWAARYSAVSPPVNPVAPNSTRSYRREASICGILSGAPEGQQVKRAPQTTSQRPRRPLHVHKLQRGRFTNVRP